MKYFLISILFVACNSKPTVKSQFDNIEKVFETGNWQTVVDGKDTVYMFFSREGDALFRVYTYNIENGDSVKSHMESIYSRDGRIIWGGGELTRATESEIVWGKNTMFKKLDSLHIDFTSDHLHTTMQRTLPISTFLVRKKYDFLHGTNTAEATVDTVRRRH